MSANNNNKVLILVIVALLVTNLGMLWYFTRQTKEEVKPKSRMERMGEVMKKELNFEDAQVQQYLQLRARRDSIIRPLNANLREAKLRFIDLLRQGDVPDSLVLQVSRDVAEQQAMLEVEFFRHFRRIQAICQPAQLPLFDTMLVRMVRRNTGDTTVPASQGN